MCLTESIMIAQYGKQPSVCKELQSHTHIRPLRMEEMLTGGVGLPSFSLFFGNSTAAKTSIIICSVAGD